MIVVSVLIRVIIDLMRLEEHLLLLTDAVFLLEFMESENKIGKYKLYQSKWGENLQSNDHRLEPKRLVSEDTGRFCITKKRKEVLKWQNYLTVSAYVVGS